ncbi:hypothetical protein MMC22_000161 [Lobaria immixta]|nr:hypothetical protein [Lobaria immixta]
MPTGEISTKAIVLDALQAGKKVFIPYTYVAPSLAAQGPKSVMNMVSLQSKEDYESLRPDAWGIPTPSRASVSERESCLDDDEVRSGESAGAIISNESLDMVIMPGMAFDKGLARLGHGKGYYDFFLQRLHQQVNVAHGAAENQMPFLVGLALKEQLLMTEKVPTDASDWPLDALIVGDGSVIRK